MTDIRVATDPESFTKVARDAPSDVRVSVDPVEETDEQPGERDVLMGVRHVSKPHIGVQFHPESTLTDVGYRLVENFCLDIASGASQSPVA